MEDILRRLVAFPTVTGNHQAAHDLIDYVDEFVASRGMYVKRFTSNGYESLVATVKPDQTTSKVMLYAHGDVVPAQDNMFELRVQEDKYLGRGVLDMKFALASYLHIIDELAGKLNDYDLCLVVTSDEEYGGENGMAAVIDKGYIPEVCIMPDGGDNWQVQTASKGSCIYEITATGKTAHGSRPWLGTNAITKLITVLDEIALLFPRIPNSDTNTITLSKMNGGQATNQVPAEASMTVDIRTINAAEYQRIGTKIQEICRNHHLGCNLRLNIVPTQFDLEDPLIKPFVQLITQHTGVDVIGLRTNGSSDARWYVPFGVPCVSVYPKGGDLHADEEWIDKQALTQFRNICRDYLEQIARL